MCQAAGKWLGRVNTVRRVLSKNGVITWKRETRVGRTF